MVVIGEHGPELPLDQLQCPAASTHGNPFRYCGSCSWVEPPAAGTAPLTDEERGRFTYRPATKMTGPQHDTVRRAAADFAATLAAVVPAGRHRALALTAVEEAMWAANAAIACDTPRPEAPVATEPGCSHPECTLTHPHAGPAVLRAREDG